MRRLVLAALLPFVLLAGCNKKPVLAVDGAWVRLAATPKSPAAGYFIVHGGPTDDVLTAVSSSVVIRIEMHESMASGNMTAMKPLANVPIPAGGQVEFKPGGKHLMMYYVNPGILPPRTLPLTFVFKSGERIIVDATVARAGDK